MAEPGQAGTERENWSESPTTQVLNYIKSKGMQPTSDNVRRVLEANARGDGILPNLENQAPPPPDAASTSRGGGGKGGPVTFTPPIPPAGGPPNTSAPPATSGDIASDPTSQMLATAAILGIPLAALAASKFRNITQPNAPADTMQVGENPSQVAARRALEANSAPLQLGRDTPAMQIGGPDAQLRLPAPDAQPAIAASPGTPQLGASETPLQIGQQRQLPAPPDPLELAMQKATGMGDITVGGPTSPVIDVPPMPPGPPRPPGGSTTPTTLAEEPKFPYAAARPPSAAVRGAVPRTTVPLPPPPVRVPPRLNLRVP